jgi:hypothetical protein
MGSLGNYIGLDVTTDFFAIGWAGKLEFTILVFYKFSFYKLETYIQTNIVPKWFVCWAQKLLLNFCFPFDTLTLSVAMRYRQTLPLQLQHEKKLYFSSLEKQDLMKTFLFCFV